MDDRYDELTLLGYLEGDLTPEQESRFEQRLAQDARLRQLTDQLLLDRAQLRKMPKEPIPPEIVEHVSRRLERLMLLGSPDTETPAADSIRHFRLRRWLAYSAVAAAFLLSASLILYTLLPAAPFPFTHSARSKPQVATRHAAPTPSEQHAATTRETAERDAPAKPEQPTALALRSEPSRDEPAPASSTHKRTEPPTNAQEKPFPPTEDSPAPLEEKPDVQAAEDARQAPAVRDPSSTPTAADAPTPHATLRIESPNPPATRETLLAWFASQNIHPPLTDQPIETASQQPTSSPAEYASTSPPIIPDRLRVTLSKQQMEQLRSFLATQPVHVVEPIPSPAADQPTRFDGEAFGSVSAPTTEKDQPTSPPAISPNQITHPSLEPAPNPPPTPSATQTTADSSSPSDRAGPTVAPSSQPQSTDAAPPDSESQKILLEILIVAPPPPDPTPSQE